MKDLLVLLEQLDPKENLGLLALRVLWYVINKVMFVYIMYYFVPRRIFADDTVSDIVAH